MEKKPIKLALFVAEWDSGDYESRFMVCLASNREEAVSKFKTKWESMYKDKDSKFVTEIDIEPYESIGDYVTEHGLDEVVGYTDME